MSQAAIESIRVSCTIAFLLMTASPIPAGSWEIDGAGMLALPGVDRRDMTGWAFGDLDGDGLLDAVTSHSTAPNFRVWAGPVPMGFRPAMTYDAPGTGRLFLSDLTGDGTLDAVILDPQGTHKISILAGDGRRSFTVLATIDIGKSDSYPARICVADLDGDGSLDLVVPMGSGVLAWGPDFQSSRFFSSGGVQFWSAAVADLDRDGRLDILGVPGRIYLGKGDRSFDERLLSGGPETGLGILDVDGDGEPEVVGGGDGISSYRFSIAGDSWRATPSLLAAAVRPGPLLVADLDLDGVEDLAFGDRNNRQLVIRFGARKDGSLRFDGGSLSMPAIDPYAYRLDALDADGDGVPDLVGGFGWLRGGEGMRSMEGRILPRSGWKARAADLDGDGFLDLVSLLDGAVQVRRGGPGGLGAAVLGQGPVTWMDEIAVAALEADARPSILARSWEQGLIIWDVDEEGAPLAFRRIPLPLQFDAFEVVDASRERNAIILGIVDDSQARTSTLRHIDLSSTGVLGSARTYNVSYRSRKPRSIDLDGDGSEELTVSSLDGTLVIPVGTGGLFKKSFVVPTGEDSTIGDFDGDGRMDLASAALDESADAPVIRTWHCGEDGSYREVPEPGHPFRGGYGGARPVAADLDGDGDDDLAVLDRSGAVLVYRGGPGGLEPGPAGPGAAVEVSPGGMPIIAGRFRGRSSLDLVVPGTEEAAFLIPGLILQAPFRRGDVNGDGRINITDAVRFIDTVYRNGEGFACPDAADPDDSGETEVTDAVYLLQYVFLLGPDPRAPFRFCARDLTEDALGCDDHASCR